MKLSASSTIMGHALHNFNSLSSNFLSLIKAAGKHHEKPLLPIPQYEVSISRHYYSSSSKLFETSLDVYKPILPYNNNNTNASADDTLPLVVLVVGSAWVGHQPIIYGGTSWWNSSGPKTLAQLGNCVCVCIRHRGAFPKLMILPTTGDPLHPILTPAILVVGSAIIVYSLKEGIFDLDNSNYWIQFILWFTAIFVLSTLLLEWARQDDATFDTMLNDVAEALLWVHKHRDSNVLKVVRSESPRKASHYINGNGCDGSTENGQTHHINNNNNNNSSSSNRTARYRPLIFGGYSSGGHVAATLLLQPPSFFETHGLPTEQREFIDGVVFLSAVLAVRPLKESLGTSCNRKYLTTISSKEVSTWLTNYIINVVFGKEGAASLPSPLQLLLENDKISAKKNNKLSNNNNNHAIRRLPHLLIGCTHEVFGIPWLDLFFCSRDYGLILQEQEYPIRYVEVSSNHWNILASTSLSNALHTNLDWLFSHKSTCLK